MGNVHVSSRYLISKRNVLSLSSCENNHLNGVSEISVLTQAPFIENRFVLKKRINQKTYPRTLRVSRIQNLANSNLIKIKSILNSDFVFHKYSIHTMH